MTGGEWKLAALKMIIMARDGEEKGSRMSREWSRYVKRFFFGEDGEWFDLSCETWKGRKSKAELPMSWTQYYVG